MTYAGLFGVSMGTGLATALSSPALYMVIAWGFAAPSWIMVWPVFLAFGLGRAAPFTLIAVIAARRRIDPHEPLMEIEDRTERLALPEAVLLVMVGVVLLS